MRPVIARLARVGAFILIVAASASGVFAQTLVPTSPATEAPSGLRQVKRVGGFEVAPVEFQASSLFSVTAPARSANETPPIELRVRAIEESLARVIATGQSGYFPSVQAGTLLDPDSFHVETTRENGFIVLKASDERRAEPIPLLTVTDLDAKYYGVPPSELGERWRAILQPVLLAALLKRQPDRLKRDLWLVPAVAAGIAALTWGLAAVRRRVRRQRDIVEAEIGERLRIDPGSPLSQEFEKRLAILSVIAWCAWWGTAAAWVLAGLFLLSLFPQTDVWAVRASRSAVLIAIIWFLTGIANRLGRVFIVRSVETSSSGLRYAGGPGDRRRLRVSTIVASADGFKSILFYIIASLLTLEAVGVPLGSVLTLGAVIAFAVSFAAQSLIKDFVNGVLIVVEDQYAAGDYVSISIAGNVSSDGFVERFNLRSTQLRDDAGRHITIGNGAITCVANFTRDWARVDYRVSVQRDTEIGMVLAVLEQVLAELRTDPQWAAFIIDEPRVLGIDTISNEGITLRAWIKTGPTQRRLVLREVNRRVLEAFRTSNVRLAGQQMEVHITQGASIPAETTTLMPQGKDHV